MIVYIGADNKCHVDAAAGRTPVEVPWMDGKCREYIEGYCFIPANEETGEAAYPWKRYEDLAAAQVAYEKEQYEAAIDELLLLI